MLLTVSTGHAFNKCISHVTVTCSCVIKAKEYADSPQTILSSVSHFSKRELGMETRLFLPESSQSVVSCTYTLHSWHCIRSVSRVALLFGLLHDSAYSTIAFISTFSVCGLYNIVVCRQFCWYFLNVNCLWYTTWLCSWYLTLSSGLPWQMWPTRTRWWTKHVSMPDLQRLPLARWQ